MYNLSYVAEAKDDATDEKRCYGSYMMERLAGSEERIDHVLQVCAE